MVNQQPIEPGAPIAKDSIDPELIRLSRSKPKVGLITAAGIVFLCGYFLVRLNADRHFAGNAQTPQKVTAAELLDNRVAVDRYLQLEGAQPLLAHAIRTSTSPGGLGLRVVPVRGSDERIWIAMAGDGWERPTLGAYVGRLRRLADLPFAGAMTAYAQKQPRLRFATAAEVRNGFAAGTVHGISGDRISMADADRVAVDVVDPTIAVVVGSKNERLPTPQAWLTALTAAGIVATAEPEIGADAVRIRVKAEAGVAKLEAQLEAAKLWSARAEPVMHHYEATWGELKRSPVGGMALGGNVISDSSLNLVGLYVARALPSDAYVVLVGEQPSDYWYVQPIAIALGLCGALFGFALFRAVKRDLLPTRA